jgi:hypothetical protein
LLERAGLMRFAFGPVFGRALAAPFHRTLAGAAIPWYLTGGIAAANCIAAYQPKGAASLAASYSNLNNPGTNDAHTGTEPAWDTTNGWKFAAVSLHKLLCDAVVGDGWSMIVRFSNSIAASTTICGCYRDAAGNAGMLISNQPALVRGFHGTTGNLASNAPTMAGGAGVYAISLKNCYRGGVLEAAVIGAGSGTGYTGIAIGALRYNDTSFIQYANVYVQAFALYDTAIDSYVAALSAAMAAL